jgi:hypothetical protein
MSLLNIKILPDEQGWTNPNISRANLEKLQMNTIELRSGL